MERNYYTDEFEQFLRNKTDEFNMFPADTVWKKIYRQLHVYRRWTMFGFSAIILGFTFFGGRIFLEGSDKAYLDAKLRQAPVADKTDEPTPLPLNKLIIAANNLKENKLSNLLFQEIAEKNNPEMSVAWLKPAKVDSPSAATEIIQKEKQEPIPYASSLLEPRDLLFLTAIANAAPHHHETETAIVNTHGATAVAPPTQNTTVPENSLTEIQGNEQLAKITVGEPAPLTAEERRYTEEFAFYNMPPIRKKISIQYYFSPSITYRGMRDVNNKVNLNAFPTQFRPSAADHIDINRYVDHMASTGFEAGANTLVTLSPGVTFRTGLQFNFSRYRIRAFSYSQESATIILDANSPDRETVTRQTYLRNFNGYTRANLQNQYLQLSLPVGLDFRILGNNRYSFNIAGALQPSYLLSNNSYMLSTDYKNYTKVPELIRRWNVHSNLDAYFAFEQKGFRWQIGPQFRYQLLSSYDSKYPIREYLRNYGFKIGVSKNIR